MTPLDEAVQQCILRVTWQASPDPQALQPPPGPCVHSRLTGLLAPSAVLSIRGSSLPFLFLVDAVCLPRPEVLASASPASTPLSSLRVCPLSESCESVEAAGDTQGDNSCDGGRPGGGDGAGGWMAVKNDAKMEGRMKGYRGWRTGNIPYNPPHLLTT